MKRVFPLLVLMVATLAAHVFAQTPKTLSVANASVTKTWTIIGYEVVVPDPLNPQNGSIGIRLSLVTKLGTEVLSTEQKSATCSGPANMTALMADADKRVRDLMTKGDQSAYYNGTRAALYAWLQANGHIAADAK